MQAKTLLTSSDSLDPLQNLSDTIISHLLEYAYRPGSKEYFGMAQTPFVIQIFNRLENGSGCLFQIVPGCMDFFGFDDDKAIFEVSIEGSIWEASSADPDTFQYTIASQLKEWKMNWFKQVVL